MVFRFGAWKAEYLQDFDVRRMMREVTLDGPDAQLAFDDYMGKVRRQHSLQEVLAGAACMNSACTNSHCNADSSAQI